jgi:RNA polymerase sigma-70 factor (ECF subfamily)
VRRAREGDSTALGKLLEEAYPLVHRWALVHTGDPTDADDLTQDVLVQVIRKLDGFRGSARFSTWLYTVTRNAAADRFRKERRRTHVTEEARLQRMIEPEPPPGPAAQVERSELADVLRAFFDELPERQRQVFDLAELQGLPSTEVGERLGIDPVSVRVSLMKARRSLRRRILDAHPELVEEGT